MVQSQLFLYVQLVLREQLQSAMPCILHLPVEENQQSRSLLRELFQVPLRLLIKEHIDLGADQESGLGELKRVCGVGEKLYLLWFKDDQFLDILESIQKLHMGNQAEKVNMPKIVQKIKISNCSKVSKSNQDLLVNNNYSRKVLLVRRLMPNDVQIVKEFAMDKQLLPSANEGAFNSLYFGDNRGCLYINELSSSKLYKEKISDFKIEHIKAMGQNLLVSQNRFLNVMKVGKSFLKTIKKIGQLKEPVNSMLPLNDLEVALGSLSFIKIYDIEKSRSIHQYQLLSPSNVLFPYQIQPPYNCFVGAGVGKSLYMYDKRTGTPLSLGVTQISDISAGLLYKGMIVLGGQSGKLQLILPKSPKPICLQNQHTGRIIGIVESGEKIVSVCQGGNINYMQV